MVQLCKGETKKKKKKETKKWNNKIEKSFHIYLLDVWYQKVLFRFFCLTLSWVNAMDMTTTYNEASSSSSMHCVLIHQHQFMLFWFHSLRIASFQPFNEILLILESFSTWFVWEIFLRLHGWSMMHNNNKCDSFVFLFFLPTQDQATLSP